MQLSTKARYAVRAMIELAGEFGKGPLQLKQVAKRQDISDKYLEQVMAPLRTQGIVYTRKGNRGGYALARPPEQITLYEIVYAVEGSMAPVPCVDNTSLCARVNICASRDLWERLKHLIGNELKSMNLADLAAEQENKAAGR